MRYSFFPKMRRWQPNANVHRKNQKGAITLLTAFLFIIFAALGMGMLYVSHIYLKISGYKANAMLLEYAAENGVKQGFHEFLGILAGQSSPRILSEEEVDILRQDSLCGGTAIMDILFGVARPTYASSWERMRWESRIDWFLNQVVSEEAYFRTDFFIQIQSRGELENFRAAKETSLELGMATVTGIVPLAQFPMLLDQNLTPDEITNFIQDNPIEIFLPSPNSIPPQILTTEETILPVSATPQLGKALNIKLFQPDALTTAQLREALGLEVSSDPVPSGVYLIQDDTGLGGIFVQGDCEKIILAIEGESQIISFIQDELEWTLIFCPAQRITKFITPEETRLFNHTPIGIILVNGAVQSLGGGIRDTSGKVEIVKDEEIPCILDGVNLTIICSDEIVLSSHLILQGVKWEEGVPYVKDSSAMLNIFSSGQDLIDGTEKNGRIVVDEKAPQEIKIQASLTASDLGFAIEGENKTVHLLGSLQTSDYTSSGNALKAIWDERFLDQDELLANTPRSAKPVLAMLYLRASVWSDKTDTHDDL